MNNVMLPWMAEVGIIFVRDLTQAKRFPLPSELLASFVVFGGLGFIAESDTFRTPAVTTAWGIVLATLLSSKVDFLKPVGDFFGGSSKPVERGPAAPAPAATATIVPINPVISGSTFLG